MKTKRILVSLVSAAAMTVYSHFTASAQSGELFGFGSVSTPSVGAWSMDRRAISQPSQYTGAMTWTMPLVSYSDPDFDIPVTLCYSYDGYRPCLHSGVVGLGWSIDCGGIITREVRGYADEALMDESGVAGYWFTSRADAVCTSQLIDPSASHPMSPDSDVDPRVWTPFTAVPAHTDHYISGQNETVITYYDPSPDIFHYSMMGHHGDFVLTRGGEVVVYNSDQPHGEVSVTMDVSITGIPTFAISTGDGYQYMFGGVPRAYEWSSSFSTENQEDTDSESHSKTISGIRLAEIIAPNGRSVRFEYSAGWMNEVTSSVYYTGSISAHGAAGLHGEDYDNFMTPSRRVVSISCSYHCPLTCVKVDGYPVVEFSYERRTQQEFSSSCFMDSSAGSLADSGNVRDLIDDGTREQKLSSVALLDMGGTVVNRANLSYFQTSAAGTPKLFLSSVSTTIGGITSFAYDAMETTVFPRLDTQATDHWGYWNGRSVLDLRDSSFINVAVCSSLYDQFQHNRIKDPDPSYSRRGALTRIEFATGGYEEISYEGNRVGRRIDQSRMGYPSLRTLQSDFVVGGVRVNSIVRHNMDGTVADSRRWEYQSQGSSLSSGILMQMPRYGLQLRYTLDTGSYRYRVTSSMYTKESLPSLTRGHHVGYSHVKEVYPDGSYVASDFADYGDYPDVYLGTDGNSNITVTAIPFCNSVECWYTTDPYSDDISLSNYLCTPASIDFGYMRGLLLRRVIFSSSGEPLEQTDNFYSSETIAEIPYAVNAMFAFAVYPYHCREAHLQNVTTTEYDASCPITVEVTNYYNSYGQLETTVRDGGVVGTVSDHIIYCHEVDTENGYITGHLPSSVCSETRIKTSACSSTPIETSRKVYSYDSTRGNPQPTSFTLTRNGVSRTATVQYDSHFRPVQIDYPGGRWTQYLWSADGRHLLGSTINDVSNSMSYTWQDLVGLTSVSMPSGQGESYVYDSRNRLSGRNDSDGNVTQTYQYHLFDQSPDDMNYISTRTYLNQSGNEYVTDVEYYDGLSYLVQKQSSHASPAGGVLIQPVVYDNMRRADATAYLPYFSSQASLTYRPDAVSEQGAWYAAHFNGDTHPYTRKSFEDGNGGRPMSSRKPGDAYAHNDTESTVDYGVNCSDDEVRKIIFGPVGFRVIPDGYYPEESLRRVTSTDEDGRTSTVFSNAFGRTLLSRQYEGPGQCGRRCDTYFVYDARDSLVCVIQPEGVPHIEESMAQSSDEVSLDVVFLDRYCFTWKYDVWGNVTESHVPGGGTSHFRYDDRDRCILYSDSEMISRNIWKQIVYDDLDRVTSEIYGIRYPEEDNDYVDDPCTTLQRRHWSASGSNIPFDLGNSLAFAPDQVAASADLRTDRCILAPSYERVYEAPTSEYNEVQSDNSYVDRAFYYDSKGRLIQTVEVASDGWRSIYSTKYDFVGNVLATRESHTPPQGTADVLVTEYSYDQRGRMLSSVTTLNGQMQHPVLYSYDELGRPDGKSFCWLEGEDDVPTECAREAISRNIQGWVKETDQSYDTFSILRQRIGYYNGQFGTPMYSGMISGTSYGRDESEDGHCYSYSYDGLGRLVGSTHSGTGEISDDGDREDDIRYDLNGNILALKRYGHGSSDPEEDLSYQYLGNRLVSITNEAQQDPDADSDDYDDSGDIPNVSYSYATDSNGRVTRDGRQALEISYNVLNFPMEINNAEGMAATYTYLSDGTKRNVITHDGFGKAYRGSFVYDAGLTVGGTASLESVATPEGRLAITDEGILDLWYAKDYLGNVRSVVSISDSPVVLEENDYLPFGTRIQDDTHLVLESNRWRYAGKEEQASFLDGCCNLIDFGARSYDPWCARWMTVDPMAHKCVEMSPYNYCAGNPVMIVDPSGCSNIKFCEIKFALTHPFKAARIGKVKPGIGCTNISTNAVRFATTDDILHKRNGIDEGSQIGAFRHALWQLQISSEFSTDIAILIGNAHEKKVSQVDMNLSEFSTLEEADTCVDLHNNAIGRSLSSNNESLNMKENALKVLEFFRENGLFQIIEECNGHYIIGVVKLDDLQYEMLKGVFQNLDENGKKGK